MRSPRTVEESYCALKRLLAHGGVIFSPARVFDAGREPRPGRGEPAQRRVDQTTANSGVRGAHLRSWARADGSHAQAPLNPRQRPFSGALEQRLEAEPF